MEWDAFHIVGLSALITIMVGVAVAQARASRRARAAVAAWAVDLPLTGVRLGSTSLRPHPQIGTPRTGDVVFSLRGVGPDGQPVTGFVKFSTVRRPGAAVMTIVEARLTPALVRGFPVLPVSGTAHK